MLLETPVTDAYTHTQFQTAPATIENIISDQGIDLNENELYDYLETAANISVTEPGNYHIQAILYDSEGNYTASTHNSTYLNTGTQTVNLRFSGPDIFNHGQNGTYSLAYVNLYDDTWLEIDSTENIHTTSPYNYTQFEDGTLNVGILNITTSQTVIGQGLELEINTTVVNQGSHTQTFNVTSYADSVAIETHRVTLASGTSTTVTSTWNTTSVARGDYTISAYIPPIPCETTITDNIRIYGTVTVSFMGVPSENLSEKQYDAKI